MRTDFVCTTTLQLLAFSSHVKYMPSGYGSKAELNASSVTLEAMQIEFLAAARGTVDVVCEQSFVALYQLRIDSNDTTSNSKQEQFIIICPDVPSPQGCHNDLKKLLSTAERPKAKQGGQALFAFFCKPVVPARSTSQCTLTLPKEAGNT